MHIHIPRTPVNGTKAGVVGRQRRLVFTAVHGSTDELIQSWVEDEKILNDVASGGSAEAS